MHDHSATGKTVYIEPEEIVELNNQIVELEYEERKEIIKILITLPLNDIRPYIDDLIRSHEFLGRIDYIRAKALLGIGINCAYIGKQSNHLLERSCPSVVVSLL